MSRRSDAVLIGIILAVIKFVIDFIKRAWKSGRLVELAVSTSVLFGIYYLMYKYGDNISGWVIPIPTIVYSLYWCYLFSFEKITTEKANYMWADRRWWWDLDGWEFEEEVAKVFRLNGFRAKVTRRTNDDGVDIIMYKDDKKYIVQCKHYRNPIGVTVARELNGIKEDFKADELIIVASSGATQPCRDFIRNKPYFKILDLEDVIRMGLRPQ